MPATTNRKPPVMTAATSKSRATLTSNDKPFKPHLSALPVVEAGGSAREQKPRRPTEWWAGGSSRICVAVCVNHVHWPLWPLRIEILTQPGLQGPSPRKSRGVHAGGPPQASTDALGGGP